MLTHPLGGIAASRHPVWMCGLRPFFLLVTITGPVLVCLWLAFLFFGLPLPAVAGGVLVWHAHELIFGFGLAAVAGFALTAVPEFTATASFDRPVVRTLAGLWLAGRLAFWNSGLLGSPALALSGLAHLGFLAGLGLVLFPRIWQAPERRHLAFLWVIASLTLGVAGFYFDALTGEYPGRWLYGCIGALMALIVVAMSRISMRIVNGAIEEAGVTGVEYRARPPRRNLAIFCIVLYTAVEFLAPSTRLGGWLALAAGAAILNLLNDWHVGRALFRRWPLMLYCVYGLMAGGYLVMGLSLVFGGGAVSAGRHLLTVGALGLNVFAVMCIAGRMHCGKALEEHPWVPTCAAMICTAALLRAGTALADGGGTTWLLGSSGLLWSGAFLLCAWRMAPLWLSPRADGGSGCEGIIDR